MRRFPRSATAMAFLGLTIVLACGETTPVEPDPVATTITATAGDGQTAMTSATLPTSLTVTVLDDMGVAFSGATVAWSVTAGGGTLSESESITGADGSASTTWTLGQAAGTQTVRATVGSLTADFMATAEAGPFMPTADAMISGTLDVTSFTVPAGVTVTAESDVVINATENFVVDGDLVADCMAMEVSAVGDLSVNGTVRNGCDTTMVDSGPDLTLMSAGALSFDSATVESMGAITISNVSGAPVPGLSSAPRNHLGLDCTFIATSVEAGHSATNGTSGSPMGSDGAPGGDITVECGGDALFEGGVFVSQRGGNGGSGQSDGSATAVGGKGGRGGDIVVEAGENVVFAPDANGSAVAFVLGKGGFGGNALAQGPSPIAIGGSGGRVGLPRVTAVGSITIEAQNALSFSVSSFGANTGGSAEAIGANGASATANAPAQPGEGAIATGGRGGAFGFVDQQTNLIGDLFDGVSVVNPFFIEISLGDPNAGAGDGGEATAIAGGGGAGSAEHPDGAAEGMFTSTGGEGGDVTLYDNRGAGAWVGIAGDGGDGRFGAPESFRGGGDGFDGCSESGNSPGGNGGAGGDVAGGGGLGGFSGDTRTGATGRAFFESVGIGGDGGYGEGPGSGGMPGTEQLIVGEQFVVASFIAGLDGEDCPGAQPPFAAFEAAAAEVIVTAFHSSLVILAVAKANGALVATMDGELLADLITATTTTMYGVAGLGDQVGQFLVFGLTGIFANVSALPSEVPPGAPGAESGPMLAPVDITLERASLSVTGVTDNDGNTTDGVLFANDPEADGAIFAQNGDNNILIVTKDGSGMPIVDPATATIFKPGGVSIFGDDRVVSAFAGADGFTASSPILVVTEATDGSGKLWRVDLVGGAAVPTEETDVFVWAGPRRVRCLMPQGICAVSSFGAGFSLGGLTLFTWDGGPNVEQVPGFSARAGSYLGIDLVPFGSDVGMVLPGFNGNDYTVDRLDSTTGEILDTNTYDAPAGCMPGFAMFRSRPDGSAPTEVLLSCNGSDEVVAVPVDGPSG